ncbi:hypothetical protein DV707_12735 [Halobellus limi]|uniref:Tripartite tricarboxylate transporter TctB family protein n=1 Tax=Halobellus limi TaxID=699433 RepID=A0A1H5YGG5_9EURY|nr:hypothetical protein DV707_12735 [Halobellus limi]SEG23173.1 hypothetical protein SAMN04488133_1584 [Halobellus limi]
MSSITGETRSQSVESQLFRYGSVLSAALALGVLLYLRELSTAFSRTPRIFPSVVIHIGIVAAVGLVVKEVITRLVKPDLLASTDDEVMRHLIGSASAFPLPVRVKRLVMMGLWTAVFFAFGTFNVLLAVVFCYVGAAYSLGVRDPKRLGLSTVTLFAFVYVVFGILIRIPLRLF